MKHILCLLILSFTLFSTAASAQGKPADTAKAGRKHKPKQTMAPAPATAPATTAPAPTSKKTPAPATTTPSTSTAPATRTAPAAKPAAVNPPNKSADKAVGTDAKGRTIYEGPRGGHYVLSPSGKKEYLKKSN